MEITLIKQIPQEVIVEVELPYYFKHDLSDDYSESIIYGKIEEELYTTIHETESWDGRKSYEIEKEEHVSIARRGLSSYFEDEHKSNKKEYEAVKERCLLFLSGC
mgnify:FL=1